MEKQDPNGLIFKQWKRRYFKLMPDAFVYSKTEDGEALREVSLINVKHVDAQAGKGRSGIFMVATNLFLPDGKPRIYILQASPKDAVCQAMHVTLIEATLVQTILIAAVWCGRLNLMTMPKGGLRISIVHWMLFGKRAVCRGASGSVLQCLEHRCAAEGARRRASLFCVELTAYSREGSQVCASASA